MGLIEKLRLKNFRSVGKVPLEIELGKRVTILIGPNNTGKSSIIRALRLLLETPYDRFGHGKLASRDNDFHVWSKSPPVVRAGSSNRVHSNIEIDYSTKKKDLERAMSALLDELYSTRHYTKDKTKESELRACLTEVMDAYCSTPFRTLGYLERENDGTPVVRREDIGPIWLKTDEEKRGQVEEKTNSIISLIDRKIHPEKTILPVLIESGFPKIGTVPRKPIPVETEYQKPFEKLRDSPPRPETVRNFLWIMKDDETKQRVLGRPFAYLVKIIREAFPRIETIDPGYDPETGKVRVLIMKNGRAFELGLQGDGLKQMLMFFVYLSNFKGDIVIIDEPERYLHSRLELKFVDFFLRFGVGQLVVATHSEAIVNSIPSESIDSGEVVVYGLSMDETGCTVAERGTESSIISILDRLGVPTTRYVKHMAALARTLIFVEGPTDEDSIRKVLRAYDKLSDLERLRPHFVSIRGASNFSKITPEVIDSVAKGDDRIKTPMVSYLIIRDRDEKIEQDEKPNELILSVREIENTVLSEASVKKLAREYLGRLGLDSTDMELGTFQNILVSSVKRYLYKWSLLRIRYALERDVRPLLKKRTTGGKWDLSKQEALHQLEEDRSAVECVLQRIVGEFAEDMLDRTRGELEGNCFPDGLTLNYSYVTQRLPGKDFIKYVVQDALVQTALTLKAKPEEEQRPTENTIRGLAGSMSNFDCFLERTEKLPMDLERFLDKLRKVQLHQSHG